MKKILSLGLIALAIVTAIEFLNSVTPAYASERPVQANQRKPRQIAFRMLDDNGTNNASISIGTGELNVTDAATGTYIFTITKPFQRTPIIVCSDASSATAPNAQCVGASQTSSGFRLYCADGDSLGTLINPVATDCIINGWDAAAGAL